MKQATWVILAITIGALLNTGCRQCDSKCSGNHKDSAAGFNLPAVKKIIEEKSRRFTNAHITRDTAFLNNIFTKDAKVFAPNADLVTGSVAISALNAEWVNFGIKEFREESTAIYGNEDFIIDEGSYYLRYGENNMTDKGKYINIWKNENGDWKIHSNIWNSNLPASAAK